MCDITDRFPVKEKIRKSTGVPIHDITDETVVSSLFAHVPRAWNEFTHDFELVYGTRPKTGMVFADLKRIVVRKQASYAAALFSETSGKKISPEDLAKTVD